MQEKSYWVVKQGKNYLYHDSKKGWVQFHAYTEKEIQNAKAQALIAFSDKGQEVVFKTAVAGATMSLGGGGLVSRLVGNYASEYMGQLASTQSFGEAFKQTDMADVTFGSLLPGNTGGITKRLITNTISVVSQSVVDYSIGQNENFNIGGETFGYNLLMKGIPSLILNTQFKVKKATTTIGETSEPASIIVNSLTNFGNNQLNNSADDKKE